jgi:hypothetical protein
LNTVECEAQSKAQSEAESGAQSAATFTVVCLSPLIALVAKYMQSLALGSTRRCHSDMSIPRDKSTRGGDTYNTRSERMQYSKYEQEESHLSVPLFSGIK